MATTEDTAAASCCYAPSEVTRPVPTPAAEVERILEAAMREARTARMRAGAEQAAKEAAHQAREEMELFEMVRDLFGITPEMRRSEDGAVLALAGPLTFVRGGHYGRGGVLLREPCPDCDGYLYSGVLFDFADLGSFLTREKRAYQPHDHEWREDSTHPRAPRNQPPPPASGAAPSPSLETRLVELLRELARREAAQVYAAEVEAREG